MHDLVLPGVFFRMQPCDVYLKVQMAKSCMERILQARPFGLLLTISNSPRDMIDARCLRNYDFQCHGAG